IRLQDRGERTPGATLGRTDGGGLPLNIQTSTLRRSTTISLVVAALSLWTVWRFTWKKESVRLLDGYDFRYFIAAAGLLVLSWLADGLRVTLTARAAGYPLAFFHGVRSILAGHFMAAITPFL